MNSDDKEAYMEELRRQKTAERKAAEAAERKTKPRKSSSKSSSASKQAESTKNKQAADLVPSEENKPKRRPKRTAQMIEQTEPGDTARFIGFALALTDLPLINVNDPKQVEQRCREYFELCFELDYKPSVPGLALALGVDRVTVWRWSKSETDVRRNAIKRAYTVLEALANDYMQNGKINPVSGAFILNNNFGYANQQELVVRPAPPLGVQKDMDEIRRRYEESMVPDE